MPSGMEERAKAAPVFNLLLRENLTEELLMSQPTVFGASQAVTMMNLALYGDSYVLTPTEFANQANQATNTASGQYAYANLIAQPASVLSTDAYVTLVLGHMGVDANPLHDAVVAYMDSVGVANRGTVTLQLGQILSGLTLDVTYGAAANAWNALVSANFAEWTGTAPVPGSNIAMTTVANENVVGTSGDDSFSGSSGTYQGGDTVTGGAGNDSLMLALASNPVPYNNVTVNGVERIVVDADGDVNVAASRWSTGVNSIGITNKTQGSVVLSDLQEAGPGLTFDLNDVSADVTLNFDQQAAQGANAVDVTLTEVTGALTLVGEGVETIETVNLHVADLKGAASMLKSLGATKATTLNIDGGLAGQKFVIAAPLPATLATVDASTFVGNLVLDSTAMDYKVLLGTGNDKLIAGDAYGDNDTISGGAGSDIVAVNFTTNTDVTREATMTGVETLDAVFNASVSFEGNKVDDLATINLGTTNAVDLDPLSATGYKTGTAASTSRADFNRMDATLTTVNFTANANQGLEVDYDAVFGVNPELTLNITGKTSTIGNAGGSSVRVINASTVNLNHNGTVNATLANGLQVDDNLVGGHTTNLSITNNSDANLTINTLGATAIVDGNTVQNLSVISTKAGDVVAGGSATSLMAEADNLQRFIVSTATASDMVLGGVGTGVFTGASDMELVSISAGVASNIQQWGVDADDSVGGGGAGAGTVTTIAVNGAIASTITLGGMPGTDLNVSVGPEARNDVRADADGANWLQAASIGTMTINSVGNSVSGTVDFVTDMDDQGDIEVDLSSLIGLDFQSQQAGSKIVVSGSALVTGLYFHDEVVTTIDASALTNKATHSTVNSNILSNADNDVSGAEDFNDHRAAIGSKNSLTFSFYVIADDEMNGPASTGKGSNGFTFLGSVGSDFVYATGSTDNLSGNAGNDFLVGYAGDDTVDGGDGDDILFGDDLGPSGSGGTPFRETGNDVLIGGAGNDILIGGNNGTPVVGGLLGDYLTGGAGNDAFVFHLETLTDSLTVATELGKSTSPTLKQDFITDFTPGQDTIFIQNDNGDNDYAIAYYNSVTADATFINAGAGDVQVVVRRGDYNLTTGTFTQFGVGSGAGADYQVLFMVDGDNFAGTVGARLFAPGAWAGGGTDFNNASHEIAVLGLAAAGGSLSTADIVFYS
jgi:hypothetical protein